ncbi:FYVE, RhoGEF and PH domain-containing protein 1-like [Haliotis rufescens]|uniref:FYVE, RhoGEF and PH domain-containing protein 1-like n=1 Tax=Haliotis rufescens TaxID=6454 RepID=UPI00201FA3E7|nr:FYVE, RhoGEF and PH domain-containing protein 1-like [Haliotis rufescens]XP_048245330.1 FYVE, RhoGEF and PH domain-containing protein 1-like [Haliotis rufescens]
MSEDIPPDNEENVGYVNADILMSLKPGDTFQVRRGSVDAVITEETAGSSSHTTHEEVTEIRIRRQRVIKRRTTAQAALQDDMAYLTVTEIVDTERTYVSRLDILNQVNTKNKSVKAVSDDIIKKIFPSLASIWEFHKDYLLPQLEERLSKWKHEPKIGDIFRQCQPFLRQYADYMRGLRGGQRLLAEWAKKSVKFASIITDIQQSTECDNLTLETHMLEPIQRLPRYQLLLQRYLTYLREDSPDMEDATVALNMIKRVAEYADDVLLKTDNLQSTLKAFQKIHGELTDSTRKRVLVKEGRISYIDGITEQSHTSYLFLFTDVLLMCDTTKQGKFTLREELMINDIQVRQGQGDNRQLFVILSKDNAFQFNERDQDGKRVCWGQEIQKLVDKAMQRRAEVALTTSVTNRYGNYEDTYTYSRMPNIFLGKWSPREMSEDVTDSCLSCHMSFETCASPKIHCATCGLVVCERCTRKQCVPYQQHADCSVCLECDNILTDKSSQGVVT